MQVEIKPKDYPKMLIDKDWTQRRCFVRFGKQAFYDKFHDFQVRDDDVWIVTLPKCGTTWMQELLWLLMNDFDYETAKKIPLEIRSPYVDFSTFLQQSDQADALQPTEELKSPRLIKSHLPLPLLPKQLWTKKPKVIYVFRHPIDIMVSSYHFIKNFGIDLDKTLEDAVSSRLNFELESNAIWNHVTEFYQLRDQEWIHYTSFENLKNDLRKEIEDVAKFLNKTVPEAEMQKLLKHLSFEEMKNNPMCNHLHEIEMMRRVHAGTFENNQFMRKGKIGSYKEELSVELIAKLDKWIDDSMRARNLTLNDLLRLN